MVPALPIYKELLDKLFFELMDNKLGTVEEMRAYLEPYSPPAPPPPVHLRRPRVATKDAQPANHRKKAAAAEATADETLAAESCAEVMSAFQAKPMNPPRLPNTPPHP